MTLLHVVPGMPHPHLNGWTLLAVLAVAALLNLYVATRKDVL